MLPNGVDIPNYRLGIDNTIVCYTHRNPVRRHRQGPFAQDAAITEK